MNLSASTQQRTPSPDFRSYEKFATTSYDEEKIVVGLNGHKIQIATKSPYEPKLSSYLGKDGLEYELPQEEKDAIVDHFKKALELKYGEIAVSLFSIDEEAEALQYGLSHRIVKSVITRATPYDHDFVDGRGFLHLFDQICSWKERLERALDEYGEFSKSSRFNIPKDRGLMERKVAQLMLQHQHLVAAFQAKAREHSANQEAQCLLHHKNLIIEQHDPEITIDAFLKAASFLITAATEQLDQIDQTEKISPTERHDITDQAKQLLVKATASLVNLDDPVLKKTASESDLAKLREKIKKSLWNANTTIREIERRNFPSSAQTTTPIKSTSQTTRSLTASSISSSSSSAIDQAPTPTSRITKETLQQLHDAVFVKLDAKKAAKEKQPALPKQPQIIKFRPGL